jgi:iron complex outermembrane recepter protein
MPAKGVKCIPATLPGSSAQIFFMKSLLLNAAFMAAVSLGYAQTGLSDTTYLQPVEITAVRAGEKTPVAKTNLSKKDIGQNNIGQDLPFLLNRTPSVVVNSDAGNGIGYTGIRLRGSDASRINVTLNGIPYNDAESQGTFFVNLPDFSSSAASIQVQRGVGTSTNGAGSFGGSINISTNETITQKSLEFNNTVGSYNSFKNTLILNSGLLGKHFTIDGRLSSIRSDGYIDRASSRLGSFYTSAAYVDNKNSLRLNIFSGHETTYQAWNGVDDHTLATNRRFNSAGTEKPGAPYDNEVDNYDQTHFQLFYNHRFNRFWKTSVALFLTKGKGYYEQYKAGESLSGYGLPDYINGTDTVTSTDLVRRLWLDNDFYGTVFSFQYEGPKREITLGGGLNNYEGKHFGEVISATVQEAVPVNYRWYYNPARKTDISAYTKWTEKLSPKWQTFVDLQVRSVDYTMNGFTDHPSLYIDNQYFFFNPKAGITFTANRLQAYLSYGRAAKEPNRDDFEAGAAHQPKAEKLNDMEAGVEMKYKKATWGLNLYYMHYRDQLVVTGKINDVGAYTRTNIPKSYRAGIELQGAAEFTSWLSANANISFSRNKVRNFTEYIDDYDNGGQQTKLYNKTDIALSPAVVSSASVNIIPAKRTELNLVGKYVSKQFLDNTSQDSRSLDAYYVQDIRLGYTLTTKNVKELKIFFQVNNLFSKMYEPNGYTFSYFSGGAEITENYYFPMAPIHFVAGLNIKL